MQCKGTKTAKQIVEQKTPVPPGHFHHRPEEVQRYHIEKQVSDVAVHKQVRHDLKRLKMLRSGQKDRQMKPPQVFVASCFRAPGFRPQDDVGADKHQYIQDDQMPDDAGKGLIELKI